MIADTVRYELALRQRRWLRAAVVATICMAFVVGSAVTDAMLGERPGRTAISAMNRLASAAQTTVKRVRQNEVSVVTAAVIPTVNTGVAAPASAPASAPVAELAPAASPEPAPVETAKAQADKPKRSKKRRH